MQEVKPEASCLCSDLLQKKQGSKKNMDERKSWKEINVHVFCFSHGDKVTKLKSLCVCQSILVETISLWPPNKWMHDKSGFRERVFTEVGCVKVCLNF